jgi:hypothetical protein
MPTLNGTSESGVSRQMECEVHHEQVYLWIHSPGSKNGWSIYVNAQELATVLHNLGVEPQQPASAQ